MPIIILFILGISGYWILGIVKKEYSFAINTNKLVDEETKEIDIKTSNTNIIIIGTEEKEVSVRGDLYISSMTKKSAQKYLKDNLLIYEKNGKFNVHLKDEDCTLFNCKNVKGTLKITIPYTFNVTTFTTNSNVTINNINTKEKTSKSVKGNIFIETANGDINISKVNKLLDIKTINGNVDLSAESVNENWGIQTTNGNVSISLSDLSNVNVDPSTTMGEIKIPTFKQDNIYNKIIKNIMINTTNGNIEVRESVKPNLKD
ncbi:DUF4097 family beta strand repeat-containing protein [Bacillus cereus]|uniref:DUF4097 family beta strand repeat-containing protein n=1 Tax=Bacillus cereus TaxID=1396 RepID=UPI00027A8E45|nr:DUF4097 family beta strand repeat-containing protein [Bacillus cereus]EJS62878.1 hypothetical protein ICU_04815 [Bacillus cereus BAG2X1-1]EJS69802.1 hypothetical protein ICY_04561 [Bacillus cereus BAG2X1-3]